jgi:hypothetical protein
MWDYSEKMAIYEEPGNDYLPDVESASTFFLDLQPPKLWEINFCCLASTHSIVIYYSSQNELIEISPFTLGCT